MWVGKYDYAFATVATVGGGTTVVYFANGTLCYSGPHLHQTANGGHLADPAPSPASGGNTDYWGWYS
jgi:hypothetical protein